MLGNNKFKRERFRGNTHAGVGDVIFFFGLVTILTSIKSFDDESSRRYRPSVPITQSGTRSHIQTNKAAHPTNSAIRAIVLIGKRISVLCLNHWKVKPENIFWDIESVANTEMTHLFAR
jgi:hypothetical protein